MEAEGDHIRRFNYTGGRVPHDVTHVTIDASVTVIPTDAFRGNRSIVEVIFDVNVKKVEKYAFYWHPSLRRVIMPGVEIVEMCAFQWCEALTHVECGKLEIIKGSAFNGCKSLGSINLPSAKIVGGYAFHHCTALTDAKFGSKLERIKGATFRFCPSLARITIPLKDGMIFHDDTFQWCGNLKHVDLVGGVHETVAALQLEEWMIEMNEEINSINQILPTASAGGGRAHDAGDKARAIRTWIRSVLRKIVHYQAATALQLVLPQDIVMNNVLPFLELPSAITHV